MSGVTVYDWEGVEKFVPKNPGFVQDIEVGKKLDTANEKLQSIRDRLDETLQVEDVKAIAELQNILARLKETLSVHDETTYEFISTYFPSVLSAIQQYISSVDTTTKSIDGKITSLQTDIGSIKSVVTDIQTRVIQIRDVSNNINLRLKKAIKNVDFSVDDMNVPSAGIGFFNVTPPVGELWRITSAYIEFPIATGATSGTNALRIIQGTNNWWEASMIMSAPHNMPSGIRYGMPMDGVSSFQPSDLTAFNNQLRDLHITADQPLCLRFNNGANALNNKKATIILKVEVSYGI